jgi:hypothetical protein
MRRKNTIIGIADRTRELIKVEGYYIFNDNWITDTRKRLINENGEIFNILDCQVISKFRPANLDLVGYLAFSDKSVIKQTLSVEREDKYTCLTFETSTIN